MKILSIALTVTLLFSGVAAATPTVPDVQRIAPPLSTQSVAAVDDTQLDLAKGGLNRVACFGITFGLALGALAAGAATGGVLWALGGAYVPVVGTVLCSL